MGYPCAVPNEESLVLSAYRVMHNGFASGGRFDFWIPEFQNMFTCIKCDISHVPALSRISPQSMAHAQNASKSGHQT